jgi:hypothetical protein
MGLDAGVYCDCFERGRLRSPPPPGCTLSVDDRGLLLCGSDDLGTQIAFDRWQLDQACEHENGLLVQHRIGNIALADSVEEKPGGGTSSRGSARTMKRACYGICYLSLAVMVSALGYGCYNAVRLLAPQSFYRSEPYANNLNYVEHNRSRFAAVYGTDPGTKGIALPPEATVTRLREEARQAAIDAERSSALEHGTNTLIVLLVAGAVFVIHRGIARRWAVAPGTTPDQTPQRAGAGSRASELVREAGRPGC